MFFALSTILLWAATAIVQAGVIKGVVLEYASGKPLSRTLVRLDPLPGSAGMQPLAVRAGRVGEFAFFSVPSGHYRLTTSRIGFFPVEHGQRRPVGYGTPVEVTKDSELFSELRMRRMGAITGTVLDENGIGMPGIDVIAYRASLPLRVAGRGSSDDRESSASPHCRSENTGFGPQPTLWKTDRDSCRRSVLRLPRSGTRGPTR